MVLKLKFEQFDRFNVKSTLARARNTMNPPYGLFIGRIHCITKSKIPHFRIYVWYDDITKLSVSVKTAHSDHFIHKPRMKGQYVFPFLFCRNLYGIQRCECFRFHRVLCGSLTAARLYVSPTVCLCLFRRVIMLGDNVLDECFTSFLGHRVELVIILRVALAVLVP